MKKLVSVIITTYNSEKTIQRTLDSILNQKGLRKEFDIELIVVDDCSTDKTVEIVKNYDLLLLTNDKNSGGPNKGRNMGIKKSSGDYICIVDHDDEWKENRLLSQLPYLEKVPIVTSGHSVINEKENRKIDKINKSKVDFLYFESNTTFLNRLTKSLAGQNTYLSGIIYRKELKDILFEEVFGIVDFDWILRLFHEKASIEICDSLYNRYVTDTNLSLNEDYRRKDFYFSLMFIEGFMNVYPKEVKTSYKKIHGTIARYYYLMNNMQTARFFFLRSQLNLKTLAYYLTSFWGAKYVKRKYNVFD
ncbi:MAG: glycosyltransferase family 2 protein [Calditrichaceae bacterium]